MSTSKRFGRLSKPYYKNKRKTDFAALRRFIQKNEIRNRRLPQVSIPWVGEESGEGSE